MNGGRRFWLALLATAFSMIFVVGLALGLAYDLAMERQQALLAEVAGGHVRLLRNAFPVDGEPDAAKAATVFAATGDPTALGPGGEILLVRESAKAIRVLARLPVSAAPLPGPIAPNSPLAEPSRAAAAGQGGILTGPDYRGVLVMAAVEAIPELGLAVVAKSNRVDVRAPFFRMVGVVAFVAACMVLAAALTVSAFGRSGKRERRRMEALIQSVINAVPDGAALVDDENGRAIAVNEPFSDLFSDPNAAPLEALIPDAAERGRIQSGEIEDDHPITPGPDCKAASLSVTVRPVALGDKAATLVIVKDRSECDRLEAALVDAENRYKALFDSPTELVALLDAEGFVDCNKAVARMFGLASRAEAVRRHPAEFGPERQPDGTSSRDGFDAFVAAALAGRPQRFDWTFTRADDTAFIADVGIAPIARREGPALIAVLRDVSERAHDIETLRNELDIARREAESARDHAETARRESESRPAVIDVPAAPPPPPLAGDRFRGIFDNSLIGTAIIDLENRILMANPALCTMIGVDAAGLNGTRFVDLTHQDDRASSERRINALKAGTSDHFTVEKRFLRRDGSTVWANLRLTPARDGDGAIDCLIAQIDDINDRRGAEQALAESERRYRSLIDNNPDGVLVFRDRVLVFANTTANALFGASEPESLIGTYVLDLLVPEDRPIVAARMETVLETHEPSPLAEFRFRRLDGSTFTAEITGTTVRWEGEAAIQSVIRDVSRRKQAEDHVRELNLELAHLSRLSSLGEMATGFAHEINQPLAAIANFARGGLLRVGDDETDRDALQKAFRSIEDQAIRAGDIVRRIRGFIQKREPERREYDLNDAIREAVALLHGEAARHIATLSFDLTEPLPKATGDSLQIQQIVLNLGRNALEAMSAAHSVPRDLVFTTRIKEDAMVEIAVADTGPGIAEPLRDEVFKPFFTTKEAGLGMGLAISRTIAEGLGGQLVHDPTYQKGTRMVLTVTVDPPIIG